MHLVRCFLILFNGAIQDKIFFQIDFSIKYSRILISKICNYIFRIDNLILYIQGHCCASYKGIIRTQPPTNSPANLKMGPYPHTIVRHGLDTDGDEFEFKFNCTDTVSHTNLRLCK